MSLAMGLGVGQQRRAISGLTSVQRARAAALVAAIDAATTIPTATGDDVVTWSQSGSFGNSTLNGTSFGSLSSSLLPRSPDCTPIGAVYEDKPDQGAPWTQTIGRESTTGLVGTASMGPGFRFRIDADAFEIACAALGPMRLKVNGAWSSVYTEASGAGFPQVKAAFATKAVRDIEFYPYDDVIIGFNVAPGDTITAAPVLDTPSVALFGDSFVEANYTYNDPPTDLQGFGIALREACNFPNLLLLGQPGQGAAKAGDDGAKTFLQRVAAGDLRQRGSDALDLVIFHNSINDFDQDPATIKANWTSIIAAARADHPDAFIWGFSGFEWPTGWAVDAAHDAAFVEAFDECAAMDALIGVWDGDGQIVTEANEATYRRPEDPHFTAAGAVHAAGLVKTQLRAFLASKT